jgi:AcrR family transcriptional regulator
VSKKQDKRDHIISIAFKTWGGSKYTNTSLSSLAESLGVTKAALYRHFKNKDEIIALMSREVSSAYLQEQSRHLGNGGPDCAVEVVGKLIDFHAQFFGKNKKYFSYLTHYLSTLPQEKKTFFLNLLDTGLNNKLISILKRDIPWPEKDLSQVIRYLYILAFFFTAPHFRDIKLPGGYYEFARGDILDFGIRGFLNPELNGGGFKKVEAVSLITPGELHDSDRIFSAIQEVVSEEGLQKASLEKISSRIGISKSSLYFHFKNKNEMLSKMLSREIDSLFRLLQRRFKGLHSFSEKLYCYILVVIFFSKNNPTLLSAINWLRFHRFEIPMTGDLRRGFIQNYGFIQEAIDAGELSNRNMSVDQFVMLIHVFIFSVFADDIYSDTDEANIYPKAQKFFQILSKGIKGNSQ